MSWLDKTAYKCMAVFVKFLLLFLGIALALEGSIQQRIVCVLSVYAFYRLCKCKFVKSIFFKVTSWDPFQDVNNAVTNGINSAMSNFTDIKANQRRRDNEAYERRQADYNRYRAKKEAEFHHYRAQNTTGRDSQWHKYREQDAYNRSKRY